MNDDMFARLIISYLTDLHNEVLEEEQVFNLIKDLYDLKTIGQINNERENKFTPQSVTNLKMKESN
tara:strand:+ start:66 stop:263 length:198 start_codon:yes stop_codon:yes gene_type:complete